MSFIGGQSAFSEADQYRASFASWVEGLEGELRAVLTRRLAGFAGAEAVADECALFVRRSSQAFMSGSAPVWGEPRLAVDELLTQLGVVNQELLHMRFGLGYSFGEIAEVTGESPEQVRASISRMVESLRQNPGVRRAAGL